MSYSYTATLLRGFGTTPIVGELHYRTALRVNSAIQTHKDLMSDQTKSRGQKSPMLARLQHKLETEAKRDLDALVNNLNTRHLSLEQQEKAIRDSMPLEKALALVAAMKGLEAGKMVALCKSNKELALAAAVAPGELTGFNQQQAFATLIAAHYPNLKAENDALEGDLRAYNSLERNVSNTVLVLGNDVDWKAMESQFDESRLEVSKPPITMADQNEELAKLEKASGIKPTGE